MTNIIEKLKASRIAILKKDPSVKVTSAFVSFIISEIQNVGKKSNRETTENEAIVVVKKNVESAEANLSTVMSEEAVHQIEFLKALLPQMVSKEDIEKFVVQSIAEGLNKGQTMTAIGKRYGATVDRGVAAQIFDSK